MHKKVVHPAIKDSAAVTNLGQKIKEAQKASPTKPERSPRSHVWHDNVELLRKFLSEEKMTATELGKLIGVSTGGTVSNWLSLGRMPKVAYHALCWIVSQRKELPKEDRKSYVVFCPERSVNDLSGLCRLTGASMTRSKGVMGGKCLCVINGTNDAIVPLWRILQENGSFLITEVPTT